MTSTQVVPHAFSDSGGKKMMFDSFKSTFRTMGKKIQRVSIGTRVHSKYFEGLGALSG